MGIMVYIPYSGSCRIYIINRSRLLGAKEPQPVRASHCKPETLLFGYSDPFPVNPKL